MRKMVLAFVFVLTLGGSDGSVARPEVNRSHGPTYQRRRRVTSGRYRLSSSTDREGLDRFRLYLSFCGEGNRVVALLAAYDQGAVAEAAA